MDFGKVLNLILPAVPGLISSAESVFNYRGSGLAKMSTVLDSVKAIIGVSPHANVLAQTTADDPLPILPVDAQLRIVIETVLAQMKIDTHLRTSDNLRPFQTIRIEGNFTISRILSAAKAIET